ncbi:deoxyribonuclease ii family protein [Dermatophagoides farinae]|nr:deoxyribonuclease ii family protein [Dermatophagoides farinae]
MITIHTLSCMNEKGHPVDSFIGYKVPKLEKSNDSLVRNGLQYLYVIPSSSSSSTSRSWTFGQRSLNDSRSILGATLKSILKNENNKHYNLIFYNDQKPSTRTRSSSTGAHAKGILAMYGKTGFWLLHSIPQFPIVSDESYEYPKRSLNNGQSFICITISIDDRQTMENVAKHLSMMRPNIYSINLTKNFLRKYPIYEEFVDKKRHKSNRRPNQLIQTISSANHLSFTIFSKNHKFNHDIYADLIAQHYQDDFFAQSWRNGAGEVLPSDCTYGYKIFNVNSIKIRDSIQWPYREDHAKWTISVDHKRRPIVCLVDLNRMRSQFSRGGGAICLESSANLWNVFKSSIYDIESCPANKVRFPSLDWLSSLPQRAWRKIDDVKQKCGLKKSKKKEK